MALPRITTDIERIDRMVCARYGVTAEDLVRRGRGAGAAKFVAVELACRLTGMSQRAIGERYGGMTSAAVSNIRRRIREGHYPLADVVGDLLARLS